MTTYFENFDYQDRDVVDPAGQSLGRVKIVFCDVATSEPHWVGVEIAPADEVEDSLRALIPIHYADANIVKVRFDRDTVLSSREHSGSRLVDFYLHGLPEDDPYQSAGPLPWGGPPPDWP